jgi:hypothetical protein
MTDHDDDDHDDDLEDLDLTVHDEDCPADAATTEIVGIHPTVDDYLLAAVEPLIHAEGLWLLDCLDLERVQRALESGGRYRLREHGGRVFRDTLRRAPAG